MICLYKALNSLFLTMVSGLFHKRMEQFTCSEAYIVFFGLCDTISLENEKRPPATRTIRRDICLIRAGGRENAVYGYSHENAWLYNE